MIYEIRNYHYEPSLMSEYKAWASRRLGSDRNGGGVVVE